jgi:hypothetical protein
LENVLIDVKGIKRSQVFYEGIKHICEGDIETFPDICLGSPWQPGWDLLMTDF